MDIPEEGELIFQTYGGKNDAGDTEYYKHKDGSWYLKDGDEIHGGFKAIGSIDITKNPAFPDNAKTHEKPFGMIVRSILNEMKQGKPPEGYIPGFKEGNVPLFLLENEYIGFGNAITRVYRQY